MYVIWKKIRSISIAFFKPKHYFSKEFTIKKLSKWSFFLKKFSRFFQNNFIWTFLFSSLWTRNSWIFAVPFFPPNFLSLFLVFCPKLMSKISWRRRKKYYFLIDDPTQSGEKFDFRKNSPSKSCRNLSEENVKNVCDKSFSGNLK